MIMVNYLITLIARIMNDENDHDHYSITLITHV